MLFLYLYLDSCEPFQLHAAKAEETNINNRLSVQGILSPLRKSSISVNEPSVVEEVFVDSGDTVKKGAPLLRLQNISGYDTDMVSVASAYLGQDLSMNVQSGAILYADMEGMISSCLSVGSKIYPAQTAVTLVDFTRAQILLEVPELYASGLRIGQLVQAVPVSDEGVTLSGEISHIDACITEKTNLLTQEPERFVKCTAELSSDYTALRDGTSLDVTIITDSVQRAITVPHAAIRQNGTQEYIYVVSEEGIEYRVIETGYHLLSGIQVKSGLKSGEWVLTDEEIPSDMPYGYQVNAA